MFDKLRIRSKLVAIVAAPLAVLLVVASLGAADRRDEAGEAREDADRLRVVEAAQAAGHAVQLEALLSVAATIGVGDEAAAQVADRRQQTDRAASDFAAATDELGGLDPAVRGTLEAAGRQLRFIDDVRNQLDAGSLASFELAGQYSLVTESLQSVVSGVRESINAPTLSSGVAGLGALAAYKTNTAAQSALVLGILGNGSLTDPGGEIGRGATAENLRADVVELGDAAETSEAVYLNNATAEGRTQLRNRLSGPDRNVVESAAEEIATAAFGAPLSTDPTEYLNAAGSVLGELRGISEGIVTDLVDDATSSADAAAQAARLYLAGAGIAVLAALALATAVAASITRPLNQLTHAVDRVSEDQLPRLVEGLRHPERGDIEYLSSSVRPIRVSGGRELSHLGDSVNTIQHVALDVATEQATLLRKGIGEMFVNLARRNQTLLDRQIEYIDALEADEQDPGQLESLFKLDHMATRMRRNAESLLVLAGAEPSRKRGRPVPVADVVRAAEGEVQDYHRIRLLSFDTAQISSGAAPDVAHLASELMENATGYSPPDTDVEVVGHHKAGGYVISISDHGIGMPAEQLAEANELLANPPLVGLTLSKSLGFIVVGRLATRFGIGVRLIPSPTGGITAVVNLPASVLTQSSPAGEEEMAAPEPEIPAESLASVTPIDPGDAAPTPGTGTSEPMADAPVGPAEHGNGRGHQRGPDQSDDSPAGIDPARVAFDMPATPPTSTDGLPPMPSEAEADKGPTSAPTNHHARSEEPPAGHGDPGGDARQARRPVNRNRGGLFSDATPSARGEDTDAAARDQRSAGQRSADERTSTPSRQRAPGRNGDEAPRSGAPPGGGGPGDPAGGRLFGNGGPTRDRGPSVTGDAPGTAETPASSTPVSGTPPAAPERAEPRRAAPEPPGTGARDAPETLPSTEQGGPRLFGTPGGVDSPGGPSLFGSPSPAAPATPPGESGPGSEPRSEQAGGDATVASPAPAARGGHDGAAAADRGGGAAANHDGVVANGDGGPEPAGGSQSATESERTQAGLVKRTPRSRGARKASSADEESPGRGVGATQRSASEVRSMLSALASSKERVGDGLGSHDEETADDLAHATADAPEPGDPARSRAGDTDPSNDEDTRWT